MDQPHPNRAPRRISLSDHDTVVSQYGDRGPAVVLAHSLGVDWRMWEPVMAPLAVGRRVFAYDLRGHGEAATAPAATAMTDFGTDLLDLLRALELEQAHLVGLSLGGAVVQTAAVAEPARVASLALLATTDQPFPDAFEARAQAVETEGMAAQIAPTLARWFTPEALARESWGVRYARERISGFDPERWAATWRVYRSLDVQDRLHDLPAPVLVAAGGADASVTPDFIAGVARRIIGSVYHELPLVPHLQTLEQPGAVADLLDAFLPAAR
jgi:3-oxoadipate enol-lactonase